MLAWKLKTLSILFIYAFDRLIRSILSLLIEIGVNLTNIDL